MGDIVIATSASAPVLRQWLDHEISIVSQEGLAVDFSVWETGNQTYLSCRCDTADESAEEVFVYYVASALTGVILNDIEEERVKRRLRRTYKSLPPAEREAMAERILTALARAYNDGDGVPRARVLLDVMDYLDEHRAIHLEGFVRFRLQDYRKQIDQAVDDAVTAWNEKLEQQEFIELLRFFMASQDSHIDSVEVIVGRNGLFRLLDDGHNDIDNDYLEGFVADLVQGAVDYGDLLISTLITLAPRRLRCHCADHLPVLDTLREVFDDRMVICRGCEVCGLRQEVSPKGPKGC